MGSMLDIPAHVTPYHGFGFLKRCALTQATPQVNHLVLVDKIGSYSHHVGPTFIALVYNILLYNIYKIDSEILATKY